MNPNLVSRPTVRGRTTRRLIGITLLLLSCWLAWLVTGGLGRPMFSQGGERAAKARADVGALDEAAKEFLALFHRRPSSLEELVKAENRGRPLLFELVLDPWGHEYELLVSDHGHLRFASRGPDGYPSAEDDIVSEGVNCANATERSR